MARKPSNPLMDEQIMDQAFSELAALVEESESLLGARSVYGRRRVAKRQLEQAIQRATVLARQLGERAAPAIEGTEQYVKQHPYKALGIAATVGLLAALLVNRRD
ncbi:DUF883 family protein [Pseudomonas japonica]|uniref:DUF883 family protein n=1 Tax=Pseudomonas japonica TaxID=256466 RepID=UPI0015E43A2A|nr:DUF883 family protein [Pseudomonas japonica]MBA1290481.1 DUF883 family protein [Pseudomonas japonica]